MAELTFNTVVATGLLGVIVVTFYRRLKGSGTATTVSSSSSPSGLSPVGFWANLRIIRCILQFRLTWGRHRSNANPAELLMEGLQAGWYTAETAAEVLANPKFTSAIDAVRHIPQGSVVYTSGFPAAERCALFFWAVKELNKGRGGPNPTTTTTAATKLTWISVGAQGARGRAPGSVEELSDTGVLDRWICGHMETGKSLLRQADKDELSLFNIPQGSIAMLIKKQGLGEVTPASTPTSSSTGVFAPSSPASSAGGGDQQQPQRHQRTTTPTEKVEKVDQEQEDIKGEPSFPLYTLDSEVGKGTYFDPLTKDGATKPWCPTMRAKADPLANTLINAVRTTPKEGGEDATASFSYKLRYSLPAINVAIVHCRHADIEGNLYLDDMSMTTEIFWAVKAAKAHGGVVIASVNYVLPNTCPMEPSVRKTIPSEEEKDLLESQGLFLRKALVDHIVIFNEGLARDSFGVRWSFNPKAEKTDAEFVSTFNFTRTFNRLLKITAIRTPSELLVGRLAADLLVKALGSVTGGPDERLASIGVGLPEEVVQFLFAHKLCPGGITLSTETGTYGGMPQGGGMFGCSIHPKKLISSAEMFELWEKKLQVACLGAIEFDPSGAVNVSRRGPRPAMDFIGSGGFPNIACSARTVIFLTKWVTGKDAVTLDLRSGRVTMHHDRVKVAKLVPEVREVTYSYSALNDENAQRSFVQDVYFVTEVAVFKKSADRVNGLDIISVAPGIDLQKDVVQFAQLHCPSVDFGSSPKASQPMKSSFLTGEGFVLSLEK